MARRLPGQTLHPSRIDPEWLDGSVWEGKRGEDYECTSQIFGQRLRGAARRRGLRVAIRVIDEDTVKWQVRSDDAP